MKRKSESTIGCRAYEEVNRLFPDDFVITICRKIGCSRQTYNSWGTGFAPSAMFLSRILQLGGDVEYILTGRRKPKENQPEFLAELEEEY